MATTCMCRACRPEAFPLREGGTYYVPEHVGIVEAVSLNGGRVDRCREAHPGPKGWVTYLHVDADGRTHLCPCGQDVCEAVAYGEVAVTLREPALA